MTEQKKLSRRDALKILGAAAGASVLANLPAKWSRPELASGVLPAHAQTSVCVDWALEFEIIELDGQIILPFLDGHYASEEFGDGGVGSGARWECQSGCVYFQLVLASGNSARVRVTTLASEFTLEFSTLDPQKSILVNLGTGEYSLDYGDPPSGCSWPDNI